jgi:transcriptional regulator with XRE-family HTH domain
MTTLKQKLAGLPAARRKKIAARAAELALEETTLREARTTLRKTQQDVAKKLKVGQDSVSRLERRGDMLVSTLREYVAALGGRVRVVVEFEGHAPVELDRIGKPASKAARAKSSKGKAA